MRLECAGSTYRVSEVGPDTMMLNSDGRVPPNGYARLVVEVDEGRTEYDVFVTCTDPTLPELAYV